MRVLFLDIDGVLNQRGQPVVRTWQEQGLQDEQVEQCIEILTREEI
jgi:hypothetical protein